MRPRSQQRNEDALSGPAVTDASRNAKLQAPMVPARSGGMPLPADNATTIAPATSATAAKRKTWAAGPNTAAGRKMARKTAHSLIERRRRSKMNEEFGVLKDMIPACTGQEMHKLAILQVGMIFVI